MEKILITPRSFAKISDEPIRMLEKAGYEVILNPYGRIMTKEQMFEQVQEVSGIIIGVDPLDKDVLKVATKLRAIEKYGVGTDNIDLDYARERRIPCR